MIRLMTVIVETLILNPICSQCGQRLTEKSNMPEDPILEKGESNMRKCIKCGYITDFDARRKEDELHRRYHELGVDEKGKYNEDKKVWEQK